MLCGDCRAHFKKHGELPPLPVSGKPGDTYLFRPVQSESPDSSPGRMRTRGKTKEQTTPGGRSRPKRGNGTSTPDNEMDKDKKPPKSPALHGSPSDKKSKSNSKETPTKSRKRNQTESDERTGDFDQQPNKRKKNNSNCVEDLDNNDESNDNYEEKAIKTEDEREEAMMMEKPTEPAIQMKNEIPDEKPVEPDPLKLAPRSPVPMLVANPVSVEPVHKQEIIEPDEEPPKLPAHTEPPEEPEKVMTIDPKTGLIGADTSTPVPILNIPTKVIVDESKPVELANQPAILIPPPPQSTPLPASKGMSIIVPQPTFFNQPKISPGSKLPPKPLLQEPLTIKVKPKKNQFCLQGCF